MSAKFRAVFTGLGLLLLSGPSWADGPCPDGQFNPQSSVCMCPGGSFVAPNTYCKGGGTQTYLKPRWGAIALDLPAQRNAAFAHSENSQAEANAKALKYCGQSGCKVYLTFKNTCGAVASDTRGVLGGGVAIHETDAERNALARCAKNGGKNCVLWVRGDSCAGSPR